MWSQSHESRLLEHWMFVKNWGACDSLIASCNLQIHNLAMRVIIGALWNMHIENSIVDVGSYCQLCPCPLILITFRLQLLINDVISFLSFYFSATTTAFIYIHCFFYDLYHVLNTPVSTPVKVWTFVFIKCRDKRINWTCSTLTLVIFIIIVLYAIFFKCNINYKIY